MSRRHPYISKFPGLILIGILTLYADSSGERFDPLVFHTGIQLASLQRISMSNPAWNLLDESTRSVKYSIQSRSSAGDFRRRLDPAGIRDYYWTAEGSRQLGAKSLFSGSFSYRFQNARDKMWAHNRQPYSGLPFVLADSTTGDWELNGLMWNVNISRELIRDRIYGGLAVFYNVDEEYQSIFPRPKANHRDMLINAGLGAVTARNSRLGLMIKYYNIQESLHTSKYSLDQEKTPIFYKLRGLDMPLIFRGQTSEERIYSIEGISLVVDGTLQRIDPVTIDFSASYGASKADNVDGGAYPIDQGSWNDEYADYALQMKFLPWHPHDIILFSRGFRRSHRATHPDRNLEIYAEERREISAGLTVHLRTKRGWRLSPTFEMRSDYIKRVDSFNGILDYFPGTMGKYSLALDMPDRKWIDVTLGFGFDRYLARDSEIYIPQNVGFYYQTLTAADELYYSSDYSALRASNMISFGKKRRYSLALEYLRLIPERTDDFDFREQLRVSFIVEDPVSPK